jgi:hypothetical protein
MKVYEKINQLKGTNATMREIADWSYMNKICPVSINKDELELDIEYPKKLKEMASGICVSRKCDISCVEEFLQMEYTESEVSTNV